MAKYRGDLQPIVDFIGNALEVESELDILDIWRKATCHLHYGHSPMLGYDNVYLHVGVPARQYIAQAIRSSKSQYEKRIMPIAAEIIDSFENLLLKGVYIYPIGEVDDSWRGGVERPIKEDEQSIASIWKPRYLRLFISHQSSDGPALAQLKAIMHTYGVDCFLAHDNIKHTKLWPDMIKQGLQSCHAMAAIGTPGFSNSAWCNQEIGWALARGILVLPVLAGEPPYGFHKDIQGPRANLSDIGLLADRIFESLCNESRLQSMVFYGLARAIEESTSWETLRPVLNRLSKLDNCPPDAFTEIVSAFQNNPKSSDLYGKEDFEAWVQDQSTKLGINVAPMLSHTEPNEEEWDPFDESPSSSVQPTVDDWDPFGESPTSTVQPGDDEFDPFAE